MKIPLVFTSSAVALASAGLIVAGTLMLPSQPAEANPNYAQSTGKPCGFCHSKPPALNSQGKAFKAKGNRL